MMGNKGIMIALGVVFLLAFIPASLAINELFITPSTKTVDVIAKTPTNFSVLVNNTFSFTAFNFTCNPIDNVKFFKLDGINPNSVGTFNFQVNASGAMNVDLSSSCNFNFLTQTSRATKTIRVNISDNLPVYSPNILNVYVQDSIIFKNIGSTIHTVTATDSSFSQALNPGEEWTYIPTSVKNTSFTDSTTNAGGSINAFSNIIQVPTVNNAYAKTLIIHINSIFSETNIAIEIQTVNFTVAYNGESEGVIKITNVGNAIARGIHLAGDWITFGENDFDIPIGSNNLLIFKVKPFISTTGQTNMSYVKTITFTGTNIGQRTSDIRIFIPYNRFITSANGSGVISNLNDAIRLLREFCNSNPNSAFCSNTGNGSIVYRDRNISINVTPQEWINFRNSVSNVTLRQDRLENVVKLVSDSVTVMNDKFTNQTTVIIDLRNKTNDSYAAMLALLAVFMIMMIVGGFLYVYGRFGGKWFK